MPATAPVDRLVDPGCEVSEGTEVGEVADAELPWVDPVRLLLAELTSNRPSARASAVAFLVPHCALS
jgi:hypothetical protein